MAVSTRAPLRYHGGKSKLASWIIQHFPSHRIYTEAYGGGAAVLMRKSRATVEVYNDLDVALVNLFRVLRDPVLSARLEASVRLTPYSRVEFAAASEVCSDPIEQARRTLIRAYMGFGTDAGAGSLTGFRTGIRSGGKAPASADWVSYPDAIATFTRRLSRVIVECVPGTKVLTSYDASDALHYVDPPYPPETRSAHSYRKGKGYRHEMDEGGHRELAEVLHKTQGMVVLSGYPCALYDLELYPDWYRVQRQTMADGARERTEVLWLNEACARALDAQGIFAERV